VCELSLGEALYCDSEVFESGGAAGCVVAPVVGVDISSKSKVVRVDAQLCVGRTCAVGARVHTSLYVTSPSAQSSLYAKTHMLRGPTDLSLAASRRTSAGARTCSDTVRHLLTSPRGGKTPAGFTNSRYLLVLHLHKRAGSPAAALGHWLLVCGKVEGEEEEQVRGDDADTGDGGELLTSALAHVGNVGPVGAGEVGEGSEVDEACSLLKFDWGS
jgi:hypothetical protein